MMRDLDPLSIDLNGALIEASAGTGKTYTIGTLYLRLLIERGLSVAEILVVTFTNAATAELRDRIRTRVRALLEAFEQGSSEDEVERSLLSRAAEPRARDLGRERLRNALRSFDEASIFTIHGFCQRVLARHAFETGQRFDAQLQANDDALIDEVVRDFWVRELHTAEPDLLSMLRALSIADLVLLVRQTIGTPDLRIVPDAAPASNLSEARAQLDAVLLRAKQMWATSQTEIRAALVSDEMNRTKYKDGWAETYASEIESHFAQDFSPAIALPKAFEKLSQRCLREGVRKGGSAPEHPFFVLCDKVGARATELAQAQREAVVRFRVQLIDYARREVGARKERAGVQSFDDLLLTLDSALRGPMGKKLASLIRARHPAALIDEFQDTDPQQYRIFHLLYPHDEGRPFLIGDPKQAIYAFRGADVFAYLDAARDAGDRAYTLRTNWRSDPSAIGGVNAFFAREANPFLLDEIAFPPARPRPSARDSLTVQGAPGAGMEILFARTEEVAGKRKATWMEHGAALAADEVARLLDGSARIEDRRVSPRDIAVLVRTNDEATMMQSQLRALSIPSVTGGDTSVLASSDARDLEILLRALAQPNPALVKAALTTPIFSWDASAIRALDGDERAWDRVMRSFHTVRSRFEEAGFAAAFRLLLLQEQAPARLLAQVSGERRLTNLLHLGELLHAVATEKRLGLSALGAWLSVARADSSVSVELGREAAQIRLESDDDAVRVVTVHKSKGLEYGIVICPFLWAGRRPGTAPDTLRFHDPELGYAPTLELGSPDFPRALMLKTREDAGEALRTLYVAMTRARHRTIILWGDLPGAETSALAYTLHRRAEDLDRDSFVARMKKVKEEQMFEELSRLSARHPDVALIEARERRLPAPYARGTQTPKALTSRPLARVVTADFRTSSFSALTASSDRAARVAVGRDRDAVRRDETRSDDDHASAEDDPLRDFPAGPRTGDLLHRVLERVSFATADAASIEMVARSELRLRGFEERHASSVARGVLQAIDTPLDQTGKLSLRTIDFAHRTSELEFCLAVRRSGGQLLTSSALADVFRDHPSDAIPSSYERRLRSLRFPALEGFLRGFIDLVFESDGRFFLADYKSNRLGASVDDFRAPLLATTMANHHYVLQYHLYVAALDRWLAARVRGYSYETHFGGVYYLFLRGMSPVRGPTHGVYFERPPHARMEALRGALGQVTS